MGIEETHTHTLFMPVPVLVLILVKNMFWLRSRLDLAPAPASVKNKFSLGPETKICLPEPGPLCFSLFEFFYVSLQLKKLLCKTLPSFRNVFVEKLIENFIKRILLTMKVYSNPMISK